MEAQRFDGTATQGQTDTAVQSWDGVWLLSWLPWPPADLKQESWEAWGLPEEEGP